MIEILNPTGEEINLMRENAKRIAVGNARTTYNKEIHIPLIIDTIGKGQTISHFCAKAGIAARTFYYWLKHKKKPEFLFAYELALEICEALFHDLPFVYKDIDRDQWRTRLHGIKKHTTTVIKNFGSESLKEKMQGMREAINEGMISPREYHGLLNTTLTEVKIAQVAGLLHKLVEEQKDVDRMTGKELLDYVNNGLTELLKKE